MRYVVAIAVVAACCQLIAAEPAKDDKAKVDAAKAQLAALDKAVQAYHKKNNNFPAELMTLVDDKFVEAKALIDPWDKQFQYDAAGKHNDGKKPDIWTETPDKKTIGNWPEK
jgi:hypothetical protein